MKGFENLQNSPDQMNFLFNYFKVDCMDRLIQRMYSLDKPENHNRYLFCRQSLTYAAVCKVQIVEISNKKFLLVIAYEDVGARVSLYQAPDDNPDYCFWDNYILVDIVKGNL